MTGPRARTPIGPMSEEMTVRMARHLAHPSRWPAFLAAIRENYVLREPFLKPLPPLDSPLPPEPTTQQPLNAS